MVKLSSLIGSIKNTPVGIDFLKKRVPQNVEVVKYQSLKGKSKAEIFRGKNAVIVLIPKRGQKIGHFICLLPRSRHNHTEYFSSLGNSWETELALLQEPTKIFRDLLGKKYIYNRVKLQNDQNYKIQDCAAFVLCRAFFHDLKLREFVSIFQESVTLQNADDIASVLSILSFINK